MNKLFIQLLCVFSFGGLIVNGLDLYEVPKLQVYNGTTLYMNVASRYVTINGSFGGSITIKTRVYCPSYELTMSSYDDTHCSLPGYTLQFKPGHTSNIVLINRLEGIGFVGRSGTEAYKAMDVTNLHTHGLHDNPLTDDIVDIALNPICPNSSVNVTKYECFNPSWIGGYGAYSHDYNYEILDIHYPGSHWYHAHWHGSTTLDVAGGLYGAIEMLPRDDLAHWEPQIDDANDHHLIVSFVWLHNQTVCQTFIDNGCDTDTFFKHDRGTAPMNFPIQSLCIIYCKLKSNQSREYEHSGNQYDVKFEGTYESETNLTAFLVNGQIAPTLTINSNEFHRLRIVNTNMQYLLWTPSSKSSEYSLETSYGNGYPCQNWLISQDGVYFEDGPRKLWEAPYNGTVVIPPGGRADFLIICNETGNGTGQFSFWADNKDRNTALKNAPVPLKQELLLYLNVVGLNTTKLHNTCAEWNVSHPNVLRCKPQPYDYSPYLTSTVDLTYPDVSSSCSSANESSTNLSQCSMVFRRTQTFNGQVSINGFSFNQHTPMFDIGTNITHEWLITSNFHPIHHHTWPYQIQLDLADGWIAQKGDWRDTVGAPGSYLARTNLYDYYQGKLVMHCHFVPHEDHGMMTYHRIGKYKDGTYITPPNNARLNPSYEAPGTSKRFTSCDDMYALSVIESLDIDTWFVNGIKIFKYQDYCYLGMFNLVDLRQGHVDNFWVGLGFNGENYKNGENISDSSMYGNALIWSLQATEDSPFGNMSYEEVTLNNHTRNIDVSSKTAMRCSTYVNYNSDDSQYAFWFCVRPLTTDFFGDKVVYTPNNVDQMGYTWSYGEGRFTRYNMHSARGGCVFRYHSELDEWSEINSTICEHYENEITIKSDTNQRVKKIFERIPFAPLDAENWFWLSGYECELDSKICENIEEVEELEEEVSTLTIVVICLAILAGILLIVSIVLSILHCKSKQTIAENTQIMQEIEATPAK